MRHRCVIIRSALAGLALLVAVVPLPCAAEPASSGESLFARARFDEARAAFESVLASAEASLAELASAHLHLAALSLIAGDEAAARAHARMSVALAPSPSVPDGAPLRLEEILAEAVAAQPPGGLALVVELPHCPAAGAPVRARAEVRGAPAELVATVALRCAVGQASRQAEETGAREVEVVLDTTFAAAGEDLACEASARSASGVRLRSRRAAAALCSPAGPEGFEAAQAAAASARPDEPSRGAASRRTWTWVGVGAGAAVLVATAITLGIVFGTAPTDAVIGAVELEGP